MTNFICSVAKADGTKVTLRRSAASTAVLLRDLGNEGYLVLKLEEAPLAGKRRGKRLPAKAILKFTEILETLTANGLTLKDALGLALPLGGKDLGGFLHALDAKVQKGHSLHDALLEGPQGFSTLYLGLIRIGEQTGDLANIFPRLVEYLKSRQTLREKTINALVYPAFVLSVALIGVALLALFVLPALTGTISGVNPDVARQYLQNVEGFQSGSAVFFVVLGFVLGGGMVIKLVAHRSREVAMIMDSVVLKTPLLGTLVWQSFCLHVSFSLEILLSSGFPLEVALRECEPLVTNRALQSSWSRVRERVVRGSTLSAALRRESLYPEVFLGWVEVGESAHDLKRSFQHLRAFYQNQLDVVSARFATLAEPVLIVVVGILLILLVMTFVTPVFTMLGRIL